MTFLFPTAQQVCKPSTQYHNKQRNSLFKKKNQCSVKPKPKIPSAIKTTLVGVITVSQVCNFISLKHHMIVTSADQNHDLDVI